MAKIWVSSDHHFNHYNMCMVFLRPCPLCQRVPVALRPPLCQRCHNTGAVRARDFSSLNEMHERMVTLHNERVKPQDHWYCLGDLTMERHLSTIDGCLQQMHGHKRIILGNHDIAPSKEYMERFEKVLSYRVIGGLILSHIPIHPESLGRFTANVHGHTHHAHIPGRYINVCVEVLGYAPVELDELIDLATLLE